MKPIQSDVVIRPTGRPLLSVCGQNCDKP